jgi:hypothetical protein
MKRILALGLLALGMTLASQQSASAWCNFKFGAGVNWNYQGGNNCFCCGLFKSGEVPGPEYFGCCGAPGCGYPGCGYPGCGYPGPDAHAGLAGGYPAYAGGQFYGQGNPALANGGQPQTPGAATGNTSQKNPATTIPNYQQSNVPYQPTSYPGTYPQNYGYGYAPNYGYGYNPYWNASSYGGNYGYGMPQQPASSNYWNRYGK